jgi:hypothetical protein
MNTTVKKWAKFVLRWGIAALGIGIVLAKTSFYDRVMILGPGNQIQTVRIAQGISEDATQFQEVEPAKVALSREQLWTPPDRSTVILTNRQTAKLLAVHPQDPQQANQPPRELLIQDPTSGKNQIIPPDELAGGFVVQARARSQSVLSADCVNPAADQLFHHQPAMAHAAGGGGHSHRPGPNVCAEHGRLVLQQLYAGLDRRRPD